MAAPLIAVVGPTAAGKSALGLRLARAVSAEIVSCDSLQVYRGLDIGSAKATPEEQREVPHHLLDVVDLDASFSAADYARLARRAVAEIGGRSRLPLIVGGSGLYLRALLQGFFPGPARHDVLRQRLCRLALRFGDARLHRLLARVDPTAAARIQRRDRVRVVRALEVYWVSGRPLSQQQAFDPLLGHDVLTLGIAPERERLRVAVEARTRAMFERGLLGEVRALLARGHAPELRPLQAIGYRQAVAVLQGRLAAEPAQRDIVQKTMRYAKRQMTWFRHQAQAVWCGDAEQAYGVATAWLEARRGS